MIWLAKLVPEDLVGLVAVLLVIQLTGIFDVTGLLLDLATGFVPDVSLLDWI